MKLPAFGASVATNVIKLYAVLQAVHISDTQEKEALREKLPMTMRANFSKSYGYASSSAFKVVKTSIVQLE